MWDAILKDSFDRFVSVIDAGRAQLDDAAIRKLATGRSIQRIRPWRNHLVDEIGYTEDAVAGWRSNCNSPAMMPSSIAQRRGLVDALIGSHSLHS